MEDDDLRQCFDARVMVGFEEVPARMTSQLPAGCVNYSLPNIGQPPCPSAGTVRCIARRRCMRMRFLEIENVALSSS
jgi:hypothetical protein